MEVSSTPVPRARLARPACRHMSACAEGVSTGITIRQIDIAVERQEVVHFIGAVTRIGLQIRLIQGPTNLWDVRRAGETVKIEGPSEGCRGRVACLKAATRSTSESVHDLSRVGFQP